MKRIRRFFRRVRSVIDALVLIYYLIRLLRKDGL